MPARGDHADLWRAALVLADDSQPPAQRMLSAVRSLVPGDIVGYNLMALERGRAIVVADPPEAVFDGGPDILAQHALDNPLVRYYQSTGAMNAVKFSDFASRAQLHRTLLYQLVYRRLGVEHQIAVVLSHAPMAAITVNRARPDFSEHERRLLDQLQPLLSAYVHEQERRWHLERTLEVTGDACLVVDGALCVLDASARATDVLERAFGPAALRCGRLPQPIEDWLRARLAAVQDDQEVDLAILVRPLCVETRAGQLTVEARSLDGMTERVLLVLHLESRALDEQTLYCLGLSPRERDVLRLAARGWSAAAIAEELVTSPRTVENHLARVYRRLGVTTRSDALRVCRAAQRQRTARGPFSTEVE